MEQIQLNDNKMYKVSGKRKIHNYICKFTTNDDIDVVIKEFEEYLDKIDLKTRYEILPENYKGWLG